MLWYKGRQHTTYIPGCETIGSCAWTEMDAQNSDKGELTMKSTCEAEERRALKRNTVHLPAIAVVSAKPTILLGQIQDISLGGLSFTYMYSALQHNEASKLDILLPGEKYYLNGLPFKTVSDSVIPRMNPFSMITMSRRGVRFSNLTPYQMSQIEELIRKARMIPSAATPLLKQYEERTTPTLCRHTSLRKTVTA